MISVTPTFLQKAIDQIRKVKAKLEVLWTDPYVQPGILVAATESNHTSWENPHVVDVLDTTPHKYFILDGTNILDGTFFTCPGTKELADENQFGWYGETVSAGDGSLSSYPEVLITFPVRSIESIRVVGEQTLNQYPVDFNVSIYNGVVSLYDVEYSNNTQVVFTDDISHLSITEATSMKLIIKKWSAGDTITKIVEFFETILSVFYDDDIVSINLLEEREIRGATLPIGNLSINEVDITLQNIAVDYNGESIIDPFFPSNINSPYHTLLLPNRRVVVYFGFDGAEYVKVGTFWTGDFKIKDSDYSMSFSARDRMDLLRRNDFLCDQLFENISLKDLAEYVLSHARVNIPLSDLQWTIDADYDNFIIPYAWFNKTNYMAALRDIAEAGLGQVYMSKDDVVIVEGYSANSPVESDLSISDDEYFVRDQPSNDSDLSNQIEVTTQPLLPEEEKSNVHTSEVYLISPFQTIIDIEINFSSLPSIVEEGDVTFIEITGGILPQISEFKSYPWGVILSIYNSSSNSGTFRIKVDGYVYKVQGSETVIEQDADSIRENGKRTFKLGNNHLVQTRSIALTIAQILLSAYKDSRKDIVIEWIGNPAIELGDTLTIPEYVRGNVYGSFINFKNQLLYDGGLRGIINGRRVYLPETTTTTAGS